MGQVVGERLPHSDIMRMTTEVVAAYVGHNKVEIEHISEVIKSVYATVAELNNHAEMVAKGKQKPAIITNQKPAVPINTSIQPDYLICLEDGVRMKMLKRRLRSIYGLSPAEYRAKWGLEPNYPMVAPNYSKQRSDFAKEIGLGKR